MSYRVHYSLAITPERVRVRKALEKLRKTKPMLDSVLFDRSGFSWDDHELDLVEFSKSFPNVMLTLTIERRR